MLKYSFFVIFCQLVLLTYARFPDEPKPCKYEDSDCIVKLINYFLAEKSEGDSAINLIKIDPLSVSKISIKQGEENPVNIDLEFSNNQIFGLKEGAAYKVNGFSKDLTGKSEIHMKFKKVSLVGDYKIGGKILILPISGEGTSNITMVDSDLDMHFSGIKYNKDGATHMKIENLEITVQPKRIYYQFNNLFNGDKALGDNMNLFLNENWSDIYQEVRDSFREAFAKIFETVLNNVFTKYPYEKFFSNE